MYEHVYEHALCTYVLIWPRIHWEIASQNTSVPHRVINYRYGDDQPLIRITIIAIDSFACVPQPDLPETYEKEQSD